MNLERKKILGVEVSDASMQEVLEFIDNFLLKTEKKGYIVTPNPEIVTHAYHYPELKRILNNAVLSLCDGIGLFLAAKSLNAPLKERLPGVDVMERLVEKMSKKPVKIGFLGGKQGVALLTANCLINKYPGLDVVFVGEEPDKGEWENATLLAKEQIDILFVAYGFPKQEEWMAMNIDSLNVRLMMGVGGAFDYMSGRVSRAPFVVQRMGLEWAYRLLLQPWRIRRQMALLRFIGLVLREKMGNSKEHGAKSNA